jgi:alpha-beta hydrolase superfamily lysophospholipase
MINFFGRLRIPVHKYFVTGASEGGLVAAKSIEEDPGSYAGGLAVCGPVGSFQKQLNYFGDVRVLFDYFFPGVLTSAGGTAIDILPALIQNWFTQYEPAVIKAVNSNPVATLQLINTAQIEIGLNLSNAANAIAGVLWYNVFATGNA